MSVTPSEEKEAKHQQEQEAKPINLGNSSAIIATNLNFIPAASSPYDNDLEPESKPEPAPVQLASQRISRAFLTTFGAMANPTYEDAIDSMFSDNTIQTIGDLRSLVDHLPRHIDYIYNHIRTSQQFTSSDREELRQIFPDHHENIASDFSSPSDHRNRI